MKLSLGHVRACALTLAIVGSTLPALSCGFEDPKSVAFVRGLLNVAFPNSLHVTSAVWRAQAEEVIPRLPAPTPGDMLFGYHKIAAKLSAVRGGLAAAMDESETPPISMVLIGPVLWTRFVPDGAELGMTVHSTGPQPGDVVVVTDVPVVIALTEKRIDVSTAISLDLVKFYGPSEAVVRAKQWLHNWSH